MSRTQVKVCCILNAAEARLALACGADAIGLVSEMPSGPGVISEAAIAEILHSLPNAGIAWLLTSLADTEAIVAQHRRCPAGTLQLCDRLELGSYATLRAALPGVRLVQVIQVSGQQAIAEAERAAPFVDGVLLDSGRVGGGTRILGGTGRVHDWNISRAIREKISLPLWLAGGLNPENVAAGIAAVSPHGVDVCSGLRPEGSLDADRLRSFIETAHESPGPPA